MTSRLNQFIESMSRWGSQRPMKMDLPGRSGDTQDTGGTAAAATTTRKLTSEELLDPEVLASIGGMDLVSRTVVDGVMSGIHRSTHKGGCSEFEDHRPYSNGDELRHLDWRLLARRDRYYIKQFSDETNLQAWIALDTSGSMQFGSSTISKFDYARTAAACLARLLLKQRDSVGLSMQARGHSVFLPARPRSSHFQAMLQRLVQSQAAGSSVIETSLDTLASRIKRRGLIMVFSDCLGEVAPFSKRLKQLRARGNDVLVFQILAPEEVTFDFRGNSEFLDLEGVIAPLDVDASTIRKAYLARFQRHMNELDDAITKSGCDRVVMTTDQPLADVLTTYLLRRQAASRSRK